MGQSATTKIYNDLDSWIQSGQANKVSAFLARLAAAQASRAKDSETQTLQAIDIDSLCLTNSTRTPLMQAVVYGQAEIARLLLEASRNDTMVPQVNPNTLDEYKQTALHWSMKSVSRQHAPQICTLLMSYQADPCIASKDNETPLDCARSNGCGYSVRAIQDRVKLWQGWVDYYEQELLVIPTWKPKWLVILQDRRPNTGKNRSRQLSCSSCSHIQPMPAYTPQFTCGQCQQAIAVAPSLQMAIYDTRTASRDGDVPLVTVPQFVVRLPQAAHLLSAEPLDDSAVSSTVSALWKGNFKRALQSGVGSTQQHGVSLKVLDSRRMPTEEHSFRLPSEADRRNLLDILRDPVKAAYYAVQSPSQGALLPPEPQAPGTAAASRPSSTPAAPGISRLGTLQQPPPPPFHAPWNCPRCTYCHEGDLAVLASCTICDAPRGDTGEAASEAANEPVQRGRAPDPSAPVAALEPHSHASGTGISFKAMAQQALQTEAIASPSEPAGYQPPPHTPAPPLAPGVPMAPAAPVAPSAPMAPAAPVVGAEPIAVTAVAAEPATAPVVTPGVAATAQAAEAAEDDDESGMCVLCLERQADSAVVPCGHMCGCGVCLQDVQKSAKPECPMCRGPISSIIKIFKS